MMYPDGSTIQVGDLIWWNEGCCTGYVQEIAESKEECESWGLDSPHIFVSGTHPFDAASRNGIGYPETSFAAEAISRFTPDERIELGLATVEAHSLIERGLATVQAHSLAGIDSDHLIYIVDADVENCKQVGWVFTFIKDRIVAEVVKVSMKR